MNPEMNPVEARTALDAATAAQERVLARAGWMATYMFAFGAAFGAATLLLGMVGSFWWRMGLFMVLWVAFVLAMVRWAAGRPALARTVRRRVISFWVGTGVLFAAVLFVGMGRFGGEIGYWLPGAVVVALPLVSGGLMERRS